MTKAIIFTTLTWRSCTPHGQNNRGCIAGTDIGAKKTQRLQMPSKVLENKSKR